MAELGVSRSTNRARRIVTDELMRRIRILSHQSYVDAFAPLPISTAARTGVIRVLPSSDHGSRLVLSAG